jgi:hypothetical protein
MNSGWWPTPNASLGVRGSSANVAIKAMKGEKRPSGARIQKDLGAMVKLWPTPSTRDHKGGYIGGRMRNGKISWDTLDVSVQHTDNQQKTSGSLNPTWVEWLMGFPIDHTDLKPSETP